MLHKYASHGNMGIIYNTVQVKTWSMHSIISGT